MLNERNYVLSVTRLEVIDLMMGCTNIVFQSRDEMKDPECPDYRRTHVLPETIEKWQKLHDKLERQLDILDALSAEESED